MVLYKYKGYYFYKRLEYMENLMHYLIIIVKDSIKLYRIYIVSLLFICLQYLTVINFMSFAPLLPICEIAISIPILDFFLGEKNFIKLKYLKWYVPLYIGNIAVIGLLIYRLLARYIWASIYHIFKFFGIVLYSEDARVIYVLVAIFCLLLCDIIVKLAIMKINDEKNYGLKKYIFLLFIIFLLTSVFIFFTNSYSFRKFEILRVPSLFLIGIAWGSLGKWKRFHLFKPQNVN